MEYDRRPVESVKQCQQQPYPVPFLRLFLFAIMLLFVLAAAVH